MENYQKRFTEALEKIAKAFDPKRKAIRMVDIERSKVYSKHLGSKLRRQK